MPEPLLRMVDVSKDFSGVHALDGVSFDLLGGEIHALVGENGAGKSTLMKVLSGVYSHREYSGSVVIEGAQQQFDGIRAAERAGIAIVFQELSLVPELSIAENIFLGRLQASGPFVRWSDVHKTARVLLDSLGVDLPTERLVRDLGIGQQQLVEIAKALSHNARILILDEPTAALNEAESQTLFDILGALRGRGLGLIYISHRLDEVLALADRITILRDGRTIATKLRGDVNRQQMISLMVGRDIQQVFPEPQRAAGKVALELRDLTVKHPTLPNRNVLTNVSLQVRAGEVVGLAGLMGSGRTALLNVLFGSFPEHGTGSILVEGEDVALTQPADAIAHNIAFVTEDRKRLGLSLDHSVQSNMSLVALKGFAKASVLDQVSEVARVEQTMKDLRVKANSPETVVGTLSGGNQQKVVLGKWLMKNPKILLLDEPTRGIDVGAKQEIYSRIDELAHRGLALLVVSSELEELRGICDRILVLHEGRVRGELKRAEATPEKIMSLATGIKEINSSSHGRSDA
ncbi:monosaccharide ABC transporter ATP-binding protein, CUT2 family [Candidatus Koribacter versatilis Ellin345]|uniref:Monosaccharide ABC transporter ATP-binding protein, CUT2 family n=1 Tax=Koribacter versatilis (strain Ellin345) TaxID=204669 RepID=Q1IT91_KORVE|nr:sugar ABC transporter ATP-binding protein [Candidatus Koribacter versatilis]ABF39909.1 monosaccharide ABC transporter ATP-binding protein, CUT2 family [Candidatus Koribacter versatilis Ellin345]